MVYTASTAAELRTQQGTLLSKIATENALIDAQLDEASIKYAHITLNTGTRTAAATSGVDIADGAGGTTYGVFFAPVACTLKNMYILVNEAYVKKTTDAKIEIKDNAETPVVRFTKTMTAAGDAAGSMLSAAVSTGKGALAAGTRLDLVVTATASDTGTGHVDIIITYEIA